MIILFLLLLPWLVDALGAIAAVLLIMEFVALYNAVAEQFKCDHLVGLVYHHYYP